MLREAEKVPPENFGDDLAVPATRKMPRRHRLKAGSQRCHRALSVSNMIRGALGVRLCVLTSGLGLQFSTKVPLVAMLKHGLHDVMTEVVAAQVLRGAMSFELTGRGMPDVSYAETTRPGLSSVAEISMLWVCYIAGFPNPQYHSRVHPSLVSSASSSNSSMS